MSARQWYTTEVIAARHAREAIEYGLMEAGAIGTQTEDTSDLVRITGYFDAPVDQKQVEAKLFEALRIYNFTADGFIRATSGRIADRDWLEEWKKNWQPVVVGRFVIAPEWLSEPQAVAGGPNDRIIIRINPGMAFGTGTHETTRLCLHAIDKLFRGSSFLDVGTGTGILAIAAARICRKPDPQGGSATITAYDIDPDAIAIAKENAEVNQVADRISFRVGSVEARTPSADLVCANLTAPVIVELLSELITATCGRLILSGILESQTEMITSRLIELGVDDFQIEQDGEWIAIIA